MPPAPSPLTRWARQLPVQPCQHPRCSACRAHGTCRANPLPQPLPYALKRAQPPRPRPFPMLTRHHPCRTRTASAAHRSNTWGFSKLRLSWFLLLAARFQQDDPCKDQGDGERPFYQKVRYNAAEQDADPEQQQPEPNRAPVKAHRVSPSFTTV